MSFWRRGRPQIRLASLTSNTAPVLSWRKFTLAALIGLALIFSFSQYRQTSSALLASQTSAAPTSSVAPQLAEYTQLKNTFPKNYIYAQAYLLMDGQNGDVLVAKNIDQALPVASITKIVTALVARETFKLDEVVTVSPTAAGINGSNLGLKTGETITISDLLKGMLVVSGNDAALAIAEHYSKEEANYQPFVDKMNQFAAQHQLTNSHFKDPAGLDDEGRSSAREIAHLARYLLNDPLLAQAVATDLGEVSSTDGRYVHPLKNTNSLVLKTSPLYMSSVIGIKTGFTLTAGHCLVSAIRIKDHLFIGAVLNTVESKVTASASEMNKLFSWAESNIVISQY